MNEWWVGAIMARVTIVLLVTVGAAAWFRDVSPQARFRIWLVGLVAATLSLPLSFIEPVWRVPLGTGPNVMELSGWFVETSSEVPWFVVGWGGGVGVMITMAVVGILGAHRLRRLAQPVRERRVSQVLHEACRSFRVATGVEVAESHNTNVPVMWGIRRPTIILPPGWRAWSTPLLTSVIRHEIAHVARADLLARYIAAVALGLLWFHPLAWLVAHRMRRESEVACDAMVVTGLNDHGALSYAGHLVELARTAAWRNRLLSAPAMARRSGLSGRIAALLKRSYRPGPGVWASCLTAALVLGTVSVTGVGAGMETVVVQAGGVVRPANAPPGGTFNFGGGSAGRSTLRASERPDEVVATGRRGGASSQRGGSLVRVGELRPATATFRPDSSR